MTPYIMTNHISFLKLVFRYIGLALITLLYGEYNKRTSALINDNWTLIYSRQFVHKVYISTYKFLANNDTTYKVIDMYLLCACNHEIIQISGNMYHFSLEHLQMLDVWCTSLRSCKALGQFVTYSGETVP